MKFTKALPIVTPVSEAKISRLSVGETLLISGYIYAGRDAVLPKIAEMVKTGKISRAGIDLRGSVIFHTAVSSAGIGPTSSNKPEIESSIPELSKAGVRIHLGKGALSGSTVKALKKYNSVYAVVPPLTALLSSKILKKIVIAFPEEGMEAFYKLKVDGLPAIVAAAHGKSILCEYNER